MQKEMDSDVETIEKRLNSFLEKLQVESSILDRIVYKNKNQHNHCLYFQYLLKVIYLCTQADEFMCFLIFI